MKYIVCVLICMLPLISQADEERGLTLSTMTIKDQAGQEVGLYEESHALIVGVSEYVEGWPDLPGVGKDIQAVQFALEEQGFHVIVEENPTRDQLDDAFTDFISQYGHLPNNRLLLYFAGHGQTLTLAYGGEMGYIVPADAPNPHRDESGFLAKAMDMQQIEVYAKRIQSKHALFVFDSCFSGSIFALSRAVPESITYKTSEPVRQFITSGSTEEQVPDESIFRRQFIAALHGEADANGDGYVTGTELGEFLQDTVVNYAKGAQHPQYGKIRDPHLDKGDFVFVLPGAVYVKEIQTSPDTAQSVDPETAMWELVKDSTDIEDIQAFLETFPQGHLSKVAQLKLEQLQRQQRMTPVSKNEIQDISFDWLSDKATLSYADIQEASVEYDPNTGLVQLSLSVREAIPSHPTGYLAFVWGLDVDNNLTTGYGPEYGFSNDIGIDYLYRVAYDDSLWRAWLDKAAPEGIDGWSLPVTEFHISGNVVTVTDSLKKIGSPSEFSWTVHTIGGKVYHDKAPNVGHVSTPGY